MIKNEKKIITIQKHWRGYIQRVQFQKQQMRDLLKFYYSADNQTNTP